MGVAVSIDPQLEGEIKNTIDKQYDNWDIKLRLITNQPADLYGFCQKDNEEGHTGVNNVTME